MPTVAFTTALQRFLPAPTAQVGGTTVGQALAEVFAARPALRGYLLDDQGALRRHVDRLCQRRAGGATARRSPIRSARPTRSTSSRR